MVRLWYVSIVESRKIRKKKSGLNGLWNKRLRLSRMSESQECHGLEEEKD